MVDITIYSKNGTEKAAVKSLEYDGTFMGDRYVTVTVSSPHVINWAIGDYLEYRGERWSLWLLPATSKVARVNTYGGSIEYKDLRFSPTEEELRRCSFLDVVLSDNEIHYTNLPNFSFYCATAKDLADRIQANLDRLYPGQWTVTANPAASITDQSLSFTNNSCWDALAMANTSLGLNFTIDSPAREIVIGGEGAFIETVMEYGKGNGLKSVERTVDSNQQVVNRLYAYGNTRNIPYRYYNKRYAAGSSVYDMVQSMYLPNLMLPGICKGWDAADAVHYLDENGCVYINYGSEGQTIIYDSSIQWFRNEDGSVYEGTVYKFWKHYSLSEDETAYYCDRVWVESEDSINKCGVQEGVKFFDGSDDLVDDIYPSITGFDSTADLAEAMGSAAAAEQNLSYEQGELYEILGADVDSWDGIIPETEETTPTFHIRIKNIGFDLSDAELDASGDTPRLSMKSGMCTGREFNILECKKQVYANNAWADYNASSPVSGPWSYYLKCEVAADDSIGQYFPNDSFALAAGDKFVILGIKMPDVYVDVAENRLLKAAIIWLGENDKTAYNYSPAINNIYMAENPETSSLLKEGNVLHVYDADLGIDVEMTISQIKIKNDKQIPEYEVTLSNDKEADLVQRVTAQVQQSYTQFIGGSGGGSGIYIIGTGSSAAPTDNNAFSARRSLRMFLRKDVPDAAAGKITFSGGTETSIQADFGAFFSDWILGTGARIDENGNAEFKSLRVRENLDVAELVFNKITARDAEEIISPGRGTIESVSQLTSTQGTITLRLQENEWATITAGDICRGIFNNISSADPSNWDSDGTDANGFRKKKGFFTSYFRIRSVGVNSAGRCVLNYQLQPGTSEHPCVNMDFAVYGNTTNTSRQNSIYITSLGIAPRIVFLAGVDTYKIEPKNHKIALGNIEGLVVIEELADAAEYNASSDPEKFTKTVDGVTHYYAHLTLEGDAGFFCEDNIYLGGIINQFKAAALDAINAEVSNLGQSWVMVSHDSFVVDCNNDGTVKTSTNFTLNSSLHFGNSTCTLNTGVVGTGPACYYQYNNAKAQPTFSESNTLASKTYTFAAGSSLTSGTITVFLKGSYNGNTYTASKTVSIIANRDGEKGADGAAVRFLGPWDSSLTPVWNTTFRDCVKHNGTYWLVNVSSDGTVSLGEPATSNTNWENIGAMRFVATELLLAENGTIDLLSSNVINLYNGGNRTASINADGNGSYCIYYPESGRKMFEFSFSKNIICYNDDDSSSVAWRLGKDGKIEVPAVPRWSSIYLNGPRSTNNNSFSGNDHFTMTKYPQYLAGETGLSSKNGKIYKANHALTDGNGNINADSDYIADGWYTSDSEPMMVLTVNGTDTWQIELVHIVSGSITEKLNITSTVSGS